ncbi:hypothetical protein WJX72_002567 [[Myrmecia] bisecta]|uniref:phytol kinase n=1 Tax=[Myrmecia] bisecta TaxID=41462 RepID=A0AAW1P5G4_9CHLO
MQTVPVAVKGYLEQKLSRKLVHMTAGPLFLLTWPLFSAEPYARYLATVVPGLNAIRLVLIGTGVVESEGTVKSVSREGDRAELLRGPLYYVLVLIGVTIFYWRASPVGLVALSLMCGGDGLADIVGRRLGKTKLPYNPSKTYAGSIAMFLGGLAMSMGLIALFCSLGYFRCSMGEVFPSVAAISLVATLIESLPINQSVDDNLSVPGSAALMGYLLLGAVAPAVL